MQRRAGLFLWVIASVLVLFLKTRGKHADPEVGKDPRGNILGKEPGVCGSG